jgi:CBS-domain-containing membrane protein
MFTVYNKGSVTFQSTSGNLYNLETVDKSAESRLKPDDDRIDSFDSYTGGNKFPREAVNAYKKMANLNVSDEVYHVKDIMIKDFISINHGKTLQESYELLKEHQVNNIPVDDNDAIISMINKKVILNYLMDDLEYVQQTLDKKLNHLDLPHVLATSPITDIRRVAQVMVDENIDAIPVVNNKHILVGIVSKTNIIKAIADKPHMQFFA